MPSTELRAFSTQSARPASHVPPHCPKSEPPVSIAGSSPPCSLRGTVRVIPSICTMFLEMAFAAAVSSSISSQRSPAMHRFGASPSPPVVPYAASCHVSSMFILARNRLSPWYSNPYMDDRARSIAFFRSVLPACVFSAATRIFLSRNPILSACGIGSFVTVSYLLVRYGASPHVISRQRRSM